MTSHRFLRLRDVVDELHVEEELIRLLDVEDVIHLKVSSEGETILSAQDVERLRVARLLMSELEVNLAGVEVVMHMRDEMLALNKQFTEILESIAAELQRRSQR